MIIQRVCIFSSLAKYNACSRLTALHQQPTALLVPLSYKFIYSSVQCYKHSPAAVCKKLGFKIFTPQISQTVKTEILVKFCIIVWGPMRKHVGLDWSQNPINLLYILLHVTPYLNKTEIVQLYLLDCGTVAREVTQNGHLGEILSFPMASYPLVYLLSKSSFLLRYVINSHPRELQSALRDRAFDAAANFCARSRPFFDLCATFSIKQKSLKSFLSNAF